MQRWYRYIVQVILGLCSFMPIVAMNIPNTPVLTEQLIIKLDKALRYIDIQGIKYLLDNGIISVHSRDNFGMTPLHFAASHSKIEAIKLLLDSNANIDSKDNEGMTPLHWTAYNNQVEALALLLDRGANIKSTNKDGETLINTALDLLNHEDIAKKKQGQKIIDLVIKSKSYYINMSQRPSTLLGTVVMYMLKKSKEHNSQYEYDYVYTAQQVAIKLNDERSNELLNTLRTASTFKEQQQEAKRYLKQYIERQDANAASEITAIPLRKEGLREIMGHIHSLKDVIHLRKCV